MNKNVFIQVASPQSQLPAKKSPMAQKDEADVNHQGGCRGFLPPSQLELACLFQNNPGARASTRLNERDNGFARLLNRGSSLE